ncbi:MAG: DUF4132 domain-containing protein, partial [Chitinivibrionales bacterium]|nr:DUF4132 domain-containing protein [Chitinivibrionales bacterium]
MLFAKETPHDKAVSLIKAIRKQSGGPSWSYDAVADLEATREALQADDDVRKAFIFEVAERMIKCAAELGDPQADTGRYLNLMHESSYPSPAVYLLNRLLQRPPSFDERDYVSLVDKTAALRVVCTYSVPYVQTLVTRIAGFVAEHGMSNGLKDALMRLVQTLSYVGNAPERKLRTQILRLQEGPRAMLLSEGEAWSDRAIADIRALAPEKQNAWSRLIDHCETASGGKPSRAWRTQARLLVGAVGEDELCDALSRWFPLVDKPRTHHIEAWPEWQPNPNLMLTDLHASILKGLVWVCASIDNKLIPRLLADLALSAYKKVPGVGPRAVKVGNACIYSLGAMPGTEGVAQLAILKVRVRFRTALKGIDAALAGVARRLGIPEDQIEEMSVPSYGLTEVGLLEESIGDYTAVVKVTGTTTVELTWRTPGGRIQKSVPMPVKDEHSEELHDIKATIKDVQRMLPAQRDRLDALFIQKTSWDFPTWADRYLNHPLVGTLARRLIWSFTVDGRERSGIYWNGALVDISGHPIEELSDKSSVSLWHPIRCVPEDVLAWRTWLDEHGVRQPFKQAHREVYVLTDAERQTATYSNRFAGHIVKQHQFNSLCAIRRWKNVLKLFVDQEFPPASRDLPQWGVRAELWTDGAGDEYGEDTNDTGTFYYLATDQVRFFARDTLQTHGHAYDHHGQQQTVPPLRLESVDPLVFSEVMRDVDLFVGVASVGNDPTWSDGGPEGRYRDY